MGQLQHGLWRQLGSRIRVLLHNGNWSLLQQRQSSPGLQHGRLEWLQRLDPSEGALEGEADTWETGWEWRPCVAGQWPVPSNEDHRSFECLPGGSIFGPAKLFDNGCWICLGHGWSGYKKSRHVDLPSGVSSSAGFYRIEQYFLTNKDKQESIQNCNIGIIICISETRIRQKHLYLLLKCT